MTANGKIAAALIFIQLFFVLGGYFVTVRMIRALEASDPEFAGYALRHYQRHAPLRTAWTLLVRTRGFWFAGVPFIWLALLVRRNRRHDARLVAAFSSIKVAVALTVVLAIAFSMSGAHAIVMLAGFTE